MTAGDSVAAPTVRRPQRWLPLLVYMVSSAPGAEIPSPLLILAATRGKLMELLARALRPSDRGFAGARFPHRRLSLVNALLARRMPKILGTLPVAADVRRRCWSASGEQALCWRWSRRWRSRTWLGIERALDRVPGWITAASSGCRSRRCAGLTSSASRVDREAPNYSLLCTQTARTSAPR